MILDDLNVQNIQNIHWRRIHQIMLTFCRTLNKWLQFFPGEKFKSKIDNVWESCTDGLAQWKRKSDCKIQIIWTFTVCSCCCCWYSLRALSDSFVNESQAMLQGTAHSHDTGTDHSTMPWSPWKYLWNARRALPRCKNSQTRDCGTPPLLVANVVT